MVPPAYDSQSGTFELEWSSPDEFLATLRNAINEEAATIRETDLDRFGDKQEVTLYFFDGKVAHIEAVIDKLRRLHIPSVEFNSRQIREVAYERDGVRHTSRVVRVEERFDGDQRTEWVCYMED